MQGAGALLVLLALSVHPVAAAVSGPGPDKKVAPWLADRLAGGGSEEVLVLLEERPDLSTAGRIGGRTDRGRFVYDSLRGAALRSQGPLVGWLRSRGHRVTRFWIVNALLVRATLPLTKQIAAFPEVARIVGNPTVKGLGDEPFLDAGAASVPPDPGAARHGPPGPLAAAGSSIDEVDAIDTIEYGIAAIHANDVWNLRGVRGEGIVLASMDTGVDWTQPAIQSKYRGWNGGDPDHSYSWHDAIHHTTSPVGDLDHGTHTVGTMVGDDGAGNQIGVAPGARWIACRNMDFGNGTPARYLECMQWGLAPYPEGADPLLDGRPDLAADITNNSWSCPPSEGCDAFSLQQGFESIRAAGQMTVAAAGNSGSRCTSVNAPPAIYDSVFATGAVDSAVNLAGFSSRGPVWVDGSNRRKPDVAAPGVLVRSCVFGGAYQTKSGTSMASPHNAGAIALLWSARPSLKHLIGATRCYMERSAGPVNAGSATACECTDPQDRPNHLWGWGLINALAAIDLGPDQDGDGIADPCDCAPTIASIVEGPPEVHGDRFTNRQTFAWDPPGEPGIQYDVARGLISQLAIDCFAGAVCAANDQSGTTYVDTAPTPPAGDGYYFIVRGENLCLGTYGETRKITVCQ